MSAAIEFAGLPVAPHDVRALATLAAILSALPAVAILVAAVAWTSGTALPLAFPILAAPVIAAATVLGYPESAAKRTRLAALGETPEAVSYLAMSLRVRPSLERAIAFAAEHAEGPFGARLRRALWDVHVRTQARVEDAFTGLADEWGAWNAELKRALYAIAHAVREGSRDGLPRARLERPATAAPSGRR